jgi:hypothetical protein
MKIMRAALATALFVAVLVVVYVVHVRFFPVNIVFYSALLDVFVASALCSLLLGCKRCFPGFTMLEKIQLVVIWLLSGYALAISVPTVIDRSLSFYLLEKLEQRGGGIRFDAFERIIADEFMHEHRLVDVRLTEQLESGTVQIMDGCVVLTGKGRRIATTSAMFRRNLLPKQRLLMGEYSDALTDPLANPSPDPDYLCVPASMEATR